MIQSAEIVTESEEVAKAAVGSALSKDHPDLVCTRYAIEQDHPAHQAAPEPRTRTPKDPPGPAMIQDPAPAPEPGAIRYRLFFETQ